jgi:hypothetical protein
MAASLLLVLPTLAACSNSDTVEQTQATTARSAQTRLADEGCPVTKPNGSTPPGESAHSTHHGNGKLWTVLYYPTLPVMARNLQPDGSIREKFGWWRGVSGNLKIRGQRIDGSAPPLRARIPSGYHGGFQATSIFFPTPGCWRVTGSVGAASLTFVVLVEPLG